MASFADYTKKKKKKQSAEGVSFTDYTKQVLGKNDIEAPTYKTYKVSQDDDIAPVKKTSTKKTDERKWFEKGAFEDGYQFGDVTKTIIGSITDIGENIGTGIIGMGEKLVDAGAMLGTAMNRGAMAQSTADVMMANSILGKGKENKGLLEQNQEIQNELEESTSKFVAKDLYNEEKIAKKIITAPVKSVTGIDAETDSILGEKSDSLVQSAGQLGATAALQAVGVPWWLTTGVTTFGSESESALNEGATYDEALLSGVISAGAEILTEKISGGINFGGKTLDDALTKELARGISNKTVRTLAKLGIDAVGEGSEEILSGVMSAIGQKLTYADDKEISELFSSEEAFESFIGGAVLGGGIGGVNAIKATKSGVDYASGLTNNEKAVVDKVYEDTIAEQEQNGKKLTKREKSKIYDNVLEQMEKGYISTDTIEEVLGGETYKTYRDTIDNEESLQNEFDTLNQMKQGEMTGEQLDRRAELKEQLADLKENSNKDNLKTQLNDEVFSLIKDSRLVESYNEKSRRGQAFEADLSQYNEKYQGTIKKAVESGILNNTRRTHEFVDMITKISADKGVLFDFANNDKIAKSSFAVEGKTVNGFVDGDGNVVLNIDSPKALESTTGHEITHILEGTELYDTLAQTITEYAKSKGDYDGRLETLNRLYEGVYEGEDFTEKVNKELVADLVGDYVFTDKDFIRKLSTENRNIFEKIYDEIKYLCKVATAGSKEARELEKVKKAFAEVYRESGNTNKSHETDTKTNKKYSLSAETDTKYNEAVKNNDIETAQKIVEETAKNAGYTIKAYHGGDKFFTVFGKGNKTSQAPEGAHFFSSNKDVAYSYTGYKRDVNTDVNSYPIYEQLTREGTFEKNRVAKGGVYASFLKLENPYIVDFEGEYYSHKVNGMDINEIAEYARQNGYDGVIAKNIKDPGDMGDANWESKPTLAVADDYIVFDSKQIKSAEPITYDNDGNVIPLSERFKIDNPDIRYSLSDSEGKKLSKEQQDFFKDSKMRDDNGSLKVMYHGSEYAGFHEFNNRFSDDDTSFFFVDSNEVAQSYSGSSEVYTARSFNTVEEFNKFFEEIDAEEFEVIKQGNKYALLENGDIEVTSDTLKGLYDEFCDYTGLGQGQANYKVYLNLTNPLVVDAEGRNWNRISGEFSQEVYDKIKSLTDEEKTALQQLASWEDASIFRDELQTAVESVERGANYVDNHIKTLASAAEKLGDTDMYRLFDVATDNFTEESLRENAVKYLNTRDYATRAKEQGYDGVIFNNIVDNGGFSDGKEGASTVAIAFNSNQIKSVANNKPTSNPDIRYSLSEEDIDTQINQSMTMDEAKQMVQRAFVLGEIQEWYDGEYKNGDEWLRAQGADEVAMYIDNEYTLQEKYLNKIQGILDDKFYTSDVLEAYLNGTLTGKEKPKVQRLDTSKDYRINDERFYSPQRITEAKNLFEIANQRITNQNRAEVSRARAKILLFAHNKGASELLGLTQAELNKKLRAWGGYPASAVEVSKRINSGVADSNRWSGIENCSWLNRSTITDEEVKSLVKSVEGDSDSYQNKYIARTMLALDTHIDWSWLSIEFDTNANVNKKHNGSGRVNGFYNNNGRKIVVSYNMPNTVAHEMGHALDYQWARDLGFSYDALTTVYRNTDRITDADTKQFFDNFKIFMDSLTDNSDIRSEYTQDPKEVFARFVAKFIQWVDNTGTGGRSYNTEYSYYNDKFSASHYIEFAKLLQEKAMLDAKKIATENGTYSLSEQGEAPIKQSNLTYGEDIKLETAPIKEATPEVEATEDILPDDYAPITEEEAIAMNSERLASLEDADAPPEIDEPYYDDTEIPPDDPFADRDIYEVGNRKTKAYMYENPEVKPFFQAEAETMLSELRNSTKGERLYNDELYYATNGERGWTGVSRMTSDEIAALLDSDWKYTYADIEKGLKAIIEDNGKENNAISKRIEFYIDERLRLGYTDFQTGLEIPPNKEYTELLKAKQITEYSDEAFNNWLQSLSEEELKAVETEQDDIAPVKDTEPKERYEAIKPKPKKEPKLIRVKDGDAEQPTAKILTEETAAEKKKRGLWSYFKESVLDKGMVFESLSKKTKNRELEAKWNFIRYADGNAQTLIGKGKEGVKALKDIQADVEKAGLTEKLYNYLYHKHNVDRMTLAERYENAVNKAVFGDNVTAEMSQAEVARLEKENPELKAYAKEIYNYNKYLRSMLVEGGVISQETADLWEEMYPHYVPIRRVGDTGLNVNVPLDTGKTGVNAPVKRATGGNRDILPLFDTMAQRTLQTYKAVAKNKFGVELKNTLGTTIENKATSLDEVIDSIDTQEELLQKGENGKSPTFTVFENGEKVTFEITDEMYDALKPKSEILSYRNKFLSTMSNIQRGLLTEYNPVFMLTNAVKDVQDVLINSQHAVKTYANFPKAIGEMISRGKYYTEYMENGGGQNSYFDNDTNTFAEDRTAIKKIIGMPLDIISGANNIIERLPRLAEYIASRKSERSVEVSMLDAARVTTNFAAGGDITKFLNANGCTFLSASVNGAVQQARNFQEAKMNGFKGWVGLATKFAVAGLPAMLLNSLMWDDDEDYEELSDYVKDNYYVVAKTEDGQFVRIPKGRALAVIQDVIEQIKNAATGDDEVDLKNFLDLAISNLAPNNPLDSNVFAPIIQVASNKTWYGEDLVPTRLQDLPANEQFDESTDAISKWLGEKINYSPYKINYLLNQYSGGVGDVVLPMLTPEAERGDNTEYGNFIAPLKDKFSTDGVMNNQNVSDFYNKVDELTTNAKSSKATDEDILKYKYMNSVNAELGELYGRKREIQNDTTLTDAEKYNQVRIIQGQINTIAEESLKSYENINIQGKYATVGDLHYRWYEPNETSETEAGWQKISGKQLEKQEEVTSGLGISASEYWGNKEEYDYAYENPEKYTVAKAVGGYETYKTYTSELYDIKADKDESGKSISGSRKEKVADYINNLDADYGEKIILFKSQYNADDTYNYEIIDYLNSRDDISYEEMETILKELGFTVKSDGTIQW